MPPKPEDLQYWLVKGGDGWVRMLEDMAEGQVAFAAACLTRLEALSNRLKRVVRMQRKTNQLPEE